MTRVLLITEREDDFSLIRDLAAQMAHRRYDVVCAPAVSEAQADVYVVDVALGAGVGTRTPVVWLTDCPPDSDHVGNSVQRSQLDAALLDRVLRYALEHGQALQAIAEGEDRLRDFVESSSDLIQTTGPEGEFLYVNRAWRDTLGYALDEIPTLRSIEVVVTEQRDAFSRAIARAQAGERVHVDTVFAVKDGRRLVVSGHIVRRVDGGHPVGIYGVFRDVTEQRRAEDAQRRLVATLEATTDVVAVFTIDGRTVYLNTAGRRFLGISEGAIVTTFPIEDMHPSEARRAMWEMALPAAIRDGVWQGETTVRRSDGEDIPASQVIVAHRSSQGGIWFLSTIIRDITEWKKLDRLKSEFVSTVSHELRTPLTSMRGALGLLASGVTGPLDDKGLELVAVARSNCERLIRLINDILDLDKIEAGRLDLVRERLQMGDLVKEALDGLAGLAGVYGIRFEQALDATPTILADRDRIVQVLTNLVSNAIKFSPTGSYVRVIVSRSDPVTLRVAVENPGPGISAADRDKLFRRFQQLDGADNRKHGGTGLGLAIAKAIVEQHSGRIGFDSVPDVTTTFWFELPLVPL